jgi:hypothetical protein
MFILLVTARGAYAQDDVSNWYRWQSFHPAEDGEIGMSGWLEKPAGKHGRPEIQNDRLMYNKKELKLWGLNLAYTACAPEKEMAEKRAAFYSRYGVNAVRLHKYADGSGWSGILNGKSFIEFDSEGLDRLDYFIAQMKKQGIYIKLSPTFGVKLYTDDGKYVSYKDEFDGKDSDRVRTSYASVYLGKEIGDLQIQQTVKLLNHRNPYTGLTYAQEPAIVTVELFNEDSVLWHGLERSLKVPTLRKRTGERFCVWLKEKYGTHENLVKAWGQQAINPSQLKNFDLNDEHLDKGTILPVGNPWFFDPAQLSGDMAPIAVRLHDTMRFLYEIQNEFYERFAKAIRQAGYDGPLVASNWQAGRGFSHFYNLHSDSLIGIVDRHNYFGGARGGLKKGKFNNASMLASAGCGTLSVGMQQVADRPFMLSEWIHVQPNEWAVEGPAVIGAYGMGLQNWDVSFMFQNGDDGQFSKKLGKQAWDATVPTILGVFPAVSRQVLRGDVKTSDTVVKQYVHIPSLEKGKLGLNDKATQAFDVKTFDGDEVPAKTLAVARVAVEFTDSFRKTPSFDVSKYRKEGMLVSETGQLAWKEADAKIGGYFTIDTKGTKAVVGFAKGQTCRLGEVTIQPQSYFGAIYVSAKERDETVASAGKLIVTAIARARNTGQLLNDSGDEITATGSGPILMEPVKAQITIRRSGAAKIYCLDHDGMRTEKTIPVNDGTFMIDGAKDKTPYYLIEYKE